MIALFEARDYKSLRRVSVRLRPFQIMIGPNASGKTNVLEGLSFLRDVLREGLDRAIERRGSSVQDLVFQRRGTGFELAWVFTIPDRLRKRYGLPYTHLRYGLSVHGGVSGTRTIAAEILYGLTWEDFRKAHWEKRKSLLKTDRGWRRILRRKGERAYFYAETTSWSSPFHLPDDLLALQNVPEDERQFPSLVWIRSLLRSRFHMVHLQPDVLRRPTRPDAPPVMGMHGEHFHALVSRILQSDLALEWKRHLQTLLPDLEEVTVRRREVDNYLFTEIRFRDGKVFPSWLLSDGTLRFLALTALAYTPGDGAILLVEEPENGVHPRVIQHLYDAFSSAYTHQVVVTTHSPFFLQYAQPKEVLVTALSQGETRVFSSKDLSVLERWREDLAGLMVSGLLDLRESVDIHESAS